MQLHLDSDWAGITLKASSLVDLAIRAGIWVGPYLGGQREYPTRGLCM